MPNQLLTDIAIRALKPTDVRVEYWDTRTPGFGIRVGRRAKTFVVKIQDRWHTIGRYPALSLADARAAAKKLAAAPPPPQSALTFEEAWEIFLARRCGTVARTTRYAYERMAKAHLFPKFAKKKLASISTDQLTDLIANLSDTPGEAFHVAVFTRMFFAWAVSMRYLTYSPLYGVKGPRQPPSRTRILSRPELIAAFRAATSNDGGVFGSFVALLILTGQRKGQIVNLNAAFIDREQKTITWPAGLMKGRREHTIPYGDVTQRILDSLPATGLLFPSEDPHKPMSGFTKRKAEFDKRAGLSAYTFHDLRRTMRSGMAEIGIPPHIGERLLDHRTGAMSEIAAIYDRYGYRDEMRAAVEKWERRLVELLAG